MSAPPVTERHLPHFHRGAPWKEPVRAVVTSNVTIATALNAGDSAGGVTLAAGDRVLLTAQTTGSENGIYVAGATPARAYDFDTGDVGFGWLVFVREGTGASTTYYNTNTSAITIGSTSVTFSPLVSGVTDHGALTGLGDDDHPQYTTDAEAAVIASAAITALGLGTMAVQNKTITTQDDLLVGGASGVLARLAKGSDSQVLTIDPTTHHLSWANPSGGVTTKSIQIIMRETSGLVLATGIKADFELPVAGTWTKWRVLADQSGSIQFDLWKVAYASYPGAVGNTITGSDKPKLTAAAKNESVALTGWTTSFSAGDTVRINIDSVSTVTRVVLILEYT